MTLFLRRLFYINIDYFTCVDRSVHSSTIICAKLKDFSKMSTQKFKGIEDRYKGVIVDSTVENCCIDSFPEKLTASLASWKFAERHGIWFKIALEHSNWIPVLANNGFDFHHAKNGYVMMYKWLPSISCGIPVFAHTMLAVGALILNNKSQILVVKEKHFMTGHWKFPGGMVEPGENLIEAAQREVMEETNVKFEFASVVTLMHANKGQYGCSDFYVLVAGNAKSETIIKCEREIEDCMWVDIDQYLQQDDVTPFNKDILKHYLNYRKHNVKINFTEGIHKLSKREYTMYNIDFNE